VAPFTTRVCGRLCQPLDGRLYLVRNCEGEQLPHYVGDDRRAKQQAVEPSHLTTCRNAKTSAMSATSVGVGSMFDVGSATCSASARLVAHGLRGGEAGFRASRIRL
jgi:hypothetical protein